MTDGWMRDIDREFPVTVDVRGDRSLGESLFYECDDTWPSRLTWNLVLAALLQTSAMRAVMEHEFRAALVRQLFDPGDIDALMRRRPDACRLIWDAIKGQFNGPVRLCGHPVDGGTCVLEAGHGGHTQDGGCTPYVWEARCRAVRRK